MGQSRITPCALYTSGTLATPINTGSGANAYILGMSIDETEVASLLADDYDDSITLTIAGN